MKFKISFFREPKHTGIVVCVCWNNTEDIFSCGDDHKLLKWNLVNNECLTMTTFTEEFYPTGMHLFPKISVGSVKPQHDVILIATADGKFHIVNHNGRIEKSVLAHQGACLVAQWSPDGAGLLTAVRNPAGVLTAVPALLDTFAQGSLITLSLAQRIGLSNYRGLNIEPNDETVTGSNKIQAGEDLAGEDGFVKIWSRNGLLRSTIVQSDAPCYGASWSPDSGAVVFTKGDAIVIKQLNFGDKMSKWKAHEGLILCLAWNSNNNLIVSGAEDGFFKIWDPFGQLISASVKHDHPITSVCWAPAGDLLAVGSFNLIRLCNTSGWSHCLDRPSTGSIYSLGWSSDGTQLAAACANGHVLFAHIIEREYEWNNYICTQTGRKVITIKNILSEQSDLLDYPDRVIQVALGFGYLVVATVKQCFIHRLTSWNTPVTCDLKEGTISMILISERCMCIVERGSLSVYSYMGRLLASPRWSGMRPESLGRASISLGPDMLAVVDYTDKKVIHVFDLPTGLVVRSSNDNTVTKITHKMTVATVALCQTGPPNERQIAVLDSNRDLYVVTVKDNKTKCVKLGSQILSIVWSTETELLAGLRAHSVVAWCCTRAANQPDWLTLTTVTKEVPDLGRNPILLSLHEGIVHICKGDGSLLHVSLVTFPEKMLKHIAASKWDAAVQLCRTVENETLWACLAVLAWQHRQMTVAEEAFALIRQYHQVSYIQHLRTTVPERTSSPSEKKKV